MNDTSLFTNHAYVLIKVTQDPDIRLRDVADALGITERAAQRIMKDLVDAGYLSTSRHGRRNHYDVHPEIPMRATAARSTAIGSFLRLVADGNLAALQTATAEGTPPVL